MLAWAILMERESLGRLDSLVRPLMDSLQQESAIEDLLAGTMAASH
jgi:hypothetical protein